MTFYAFARSVVKAALLVGWRFRVVGAERVPSGGPLIVAANHVSYFDPPALGCALPRPLHYMAKQELFRMGLLGPLIGHLNAFPIDRTRGDVAAIKRAVDVLKEGAAVGIFPEGTRNKVGDIRPQSGVALLHYLSRAPILPAYIGGTARVRQFARITVTFGEPVRFTDGRKATREDLANWTNDIMRRISALGATLG